MAKEDQIIKGLKSTILSSNNELPLDEIPDLYKDDWEVLKVPEQYADLLEFLQNYPDIFSIDHKKNVKVVEINEESKAAMKLIE